MARITLQGITKVYGQDVIAVDDVDLEIRDGEFMVLLGPSGCGKSTTLRMIAGLEEVSSGEIRIDGRVVNDVDPAERDLAVVFQNYALYPHMTVAGNLAFGLKLRRVDAAEIERRINGTATMLGIEGLLGRRPRELSGGQQQRVALGRALVRDPVAFLFDEPLSNLDAKLRSAMRTELIKIHRGLGRTILHVTHDQVEAMTMGERICIMRDGRVVQTGPPLDVYRRPVDTFVAGFLASPPMNLLNAKVVEAKEGLEVDLSPARLPVPAERSSLPRRLPELGDHLRDTAGRPVHGARTVPGRSPRCRSGGGGGARPRGGPDRGAPGRGGDRGPPRPQLQRAGRGRASASTPTWNGCISSIPRTGRRWTRSEPGRTWSAFLHEFGRCS